MKNLNKPLRTILSFLPAVALIIGSSSVSQCCNWWFHQPQVPKNFKRIDKIKK